MSRNERPSADMDYNEIMWRSLHKVGWKLKHSSFRDDESGGLRHFIHARKMGEEVFCTADTMSTAISMVFRQTLVDGAE
jgi:hypothetical protein